MLLGNGISQERNTNGSNTRSHITVRSREPVHSVSCHFAKKKQLKSSSLEKEDVRHRKQQLLYSSPETVERDDNMTGALEKVRVDDAFVDNSTNSVYLIDKPHEGKHHGKVFTQKRLNKKSRRIVPYAHPCLNFSDVSEMPSNSVHIYSSQEKAAVHCIPQSMESD